MRSTRGVWISVLAVTICASASAAERARVLDKESFMEMEGIASPAISPDAKQIVFAREWIDQVKDQSRTNLWVYDLSTGRLRELTRGAWRDTSPSIIAMTPAPIPGTRSTKAGTSRPGTMSDETLAAIAAWLFCCPRASMVTMIETPTDPPRLRNRPLRLEPSGRNAAGSMASASTFIGVTIRPKPNPWRLSLIHI